VLDAADPVVLGWFTAFADPSSQVRRTIAG